MYTIDLKTLNTVYIPLALNAVTKTIGNFEKEKLVNSKYYDTALSYTYHTFHVTT